MHRSVRRQLLGRMMVETSKSLRTYDGSSMWVVVKIRVPFWVPEIIGAVLY